MKIIPIILIIFPLLALVKPAEAREMQCKYDFITFTQIHYLTENKISGNISVKIQTVDSGNGEYVYEGSTEIKPSNPLTKMYDNMYYEAKKDWFNTIYYVNFQRAEMNAFQRPESYLSKPPDPNKFMKNSQLIEIPIMYFDCLRTD